MYSELVTVATYRLAVEAHAARIFLEEHGVTAFVTDEFAATIPWNFAPTKVQVPAGEAQRASELLAEVHS